MQYKPLELAVDYFRDFYGGAKNVVQKLRNSLMPSSGLELAVAGMPNSLIDKKPAETSDKSQGYFFAEYGVKDYTLKYTPKGRGVVVTRSDGKQILLEPIRNGNFAEEAVRQALINNNISANNKLIGKIAKLLRERA